MPALTQQGQQHPLPGGGASNSKKVSGAQAVDDEPWWLSMCASTFIRGASTSGKRSATEQYNSQKLGQQ
jgi:hypothetical protein